MGSGDLRMTNTYLIHMRDIGHIFSKEKVSLQTGRSLVTELHETDSFFNYLHVANTVLYGAQSLQVLATNTKYVFSTISKHLWK